MIYRQCVIILLRIMSKQPIVLLKKCLILSSLFRAPGYWETGRVPNTKELIISDTPYIVPYRVKNNTIEILRVFHCAMKWPKIMSLHFRPRKRFGQHFLTDESILEGIIAAIGISPSDSIVEIGPGRGALTQYLLPLVRHLDVIEIDRDLTAYLQRHYQSVEKLTIHNADVLHFDWESVLPSQPLKRIVGNLPYNITTPLVIQII